MNTWKRSKRPISLSLKVLCSCAVLGSRQNCASLERHTACSTAALPRANGEERYDMTAPQERQQALTVAQQGNEQPVENKLVRSKRACINCRAIKVSKCLLDADKLRLSLYQVRCPQPQNPVTDQDPCERCARLKISCEYETDKRKRKRTRLDSNTSAIQQSPVQFSSGMQNLPPMQLPSYDNNRPQNSMQSVPSDFPAMYNLPVQSLSHSNQSASTSYYPDQQQVFDSGHYSPAMTGRMPTPAAASPTSSGPSTRPIRSAGDFATLVEAISVATSNGTTERPRDNDPDPLGISILNMAEAVSLIDSFHVRLNPFVNMFDPTIVTATVGSVS